MFLFVVCERVVVKFSYDSARPNILGNCVEEGAINVDRVLNSGEGVIVFFEGSRKISILKICDNQLSHQQISLIGGESSAATTISADGCAILFKRNSTHVYELWEFSLESGWELDTTEDFADVYLGCLSLTGTRNSRTLLGHMTKDKFSLMRKDYFLFDFSSRKLNFHHLQIFQEALE